MLIVEKLHEIFNQFTLELKMKFSPCIGECTEEGTNCEGCGRSHEEIAEMKTHIDSLVAFAEKMKYENIEQFADSVAGGIKFKMGMGH